VRAQILKRRGPAASNILLLQLGSLPHLSGLSGGNRGQVRPNSETTLDKDRDRKKVAGIVEVAGAGT